MRIVRYTSLFRKKYFFERSSNYRPPMKLREGNAFTGVCHTAQGAACLVPCLFWEGVCMPGARSLLGVCPGGRYARRVGYTTGLGGGYTRRGKGRYTRRCGYTKVGIPEGWGRYTRGSGAGITKGVGIGIRDTYPSSVLATTTQPVWYASYWTAFLLTLHLLLPHSLR